MGDSTIKLNTQFHFVTYVEKNGYVWELDGRRTRPIKKGQCTNQSFGLAVGEVLRHYTSLDTTIAFSVMALAPGH